MKTISFTIPMEREPLLTVAETLNKLADGLIDKGPIELGTGDSPDFKGNPQNIRKEQPANPDNQSLDTDDMGAAGDSGEDNAMDIPPYTAAAVTVFAQTDNPAPLSKLLETTDAIVGGTVVDLKVSPPEGVELDSDGLPWDGRIHASTKTQLSKTKQWKKIRGIEKKSPGLVEKVEAELREALAASPSNPVEVEDAAPPPPPTDDPAAPPPPPTESSGGGSQINTFAGLVKRITDDKIGKDAVDAAVGAAGLKSFALLPARVDLIPVVAIALFGM